MQTEKVIEYIVNWLKEYAYNAKVNGFVIGISGGIDSAVVSTLCAKTELPLLCVEMPIHQDKKHIARGREHIEFLKSNFTNVTDIETNLTSVFEAFKNQIPSATEKDKENLALANSRARLRMATLYYFAGIHGFLVAGTGNKIEDFGVGFYTKYGDGGVDLNPIGSLMKSEVYLLAEKLHISQSIVQATPTDGLFGDSRSDEDQLGATYPELEWAMQMSEANKTAKDFSNREKEVIEIYLHLHRINQHKMTPIPTCEIPKSLK